MLLFLCVSIGINLVMFVPAYLMGTDKLTDISYSLTFLFVASAAYYKSSHTSAQLVLLAAVSLWAIRLGVFLLGRVLVNGKDKRFDDMRGSVIKFGRFWLLQGLTVFVVLLSSLLFWDSKRTHLGLASIVGLVVFILGLVLEAIADQQKRKFSQNPANKGKWIASGVWGCSRHPNYLGEILVWSGLYVFVMPSLSSTSKITALISPLYIIVLLLFVSGIPLLEKSADKKWGSNKDYIKYKQRVPLLIPRSK
jgi:steroid 5-alpha reductase family enzyme